MRIVRVLAVWLLAFSAFSLHAAALKTRNVFLVISDGYRWQEVFTGAEERLISFEFGGVTDTNAVKARYWRETPEARRETLMPFFWNEIAKRGQLLGNQTRGSVVTVTNGRNFSYPGYNEIITGFGDPRIDSNAKRLNPNTNVFEWIGGKESFRGKVGVIGTWDVFPFIFNCDRSKLPIWPAWTNKFAREIPMPPLLTRLTETTPKLGPDIIYDSFGIEAAWDYIKREKPRLCFVGFGETDEFAHHMRYDLYLDAAHRVDQFVRDLWNYAQATDEYRDKTTIIVTADHGRGSGDIDWRSHGEKIPEAAGDWIAVIGPDTPALGESSNHKNTQSQIAATIAALLSEDFHAFFPKSGEAIRELMSGGAR